MKPLVINQKRGEEIPHSIKFFKIMADWIGAVAQAGASLANNIITNSWTERHRKRNYYWNEKAAQNADNRQREQYWDLYSPKALMGQYAAAGLSPSMMMSGGQAAVGSSSAQGNQSSGIQGPYPSNSPIDPVAMAQIANIWADTEKKEAETMNIEEDTNLKGQQIINLVADTNNKKAQFRLINAEADLSELEFSTDLQTQQAAIRSAYANAEKAANQARSAAVQADLDEATFDCAYQMAYASLDNTLTDTALKNSQINVNKEQIKEICERIRNSQWETWATEKEQNRKDAIFKLDKARLEAECAKWAAEINVELTKAELEMVSDLVGYVCNFATCGLSNATKLKQTDMYNKTKKEIANTPKTTHQQNYKINKKGQKQITSGKYTKTE